MMKRALQRIAWIMLIACLASFEVVKAQQDYQFTQFNFNKLALNPAYAGSRNIVSLTAVYRNQWTSLEGAPETFSISAHSPVFNNRIALGGYLFNDQTAVTRNMGAYLTYAYKVPIRGSVLSLGIQAGFLNYRSNFTELDPFETGDITFMEDLNKIYPNVGFGAYWSIPGKAYLGVSIPHLLQTDLSDLSNVSTDQLAQLYRHYYVMGGYVFRLSKSVSIRPSALLKFAGDGNFSSPVDMDFNLSALLIEKLWIGVGYRLSDSFNGMAEYQITDQLMAGYSYDFTLSDLNQFNSGSHEVMVRYEFKFKRNGYVTPRSIIYF